MLRSLDTLLKHRIIAKDGELGSLSDVFFDDWEWHVRYFVVDTGSWLPGKKVLLSPVAASGVNSEQGEITFALERQKIKESPSIDKDKPVSRQCEEQVARYYGWPAYWAGPIGAAAAPVTSVAARQSAPQKQEGDPNLRSMDEVRKYRIEATDGVVGHVEDFLATDDDWAIRYMVVDTRNWLPGRKVLIAPWMIQTVNWQGATVAVNLNREQVKESPAYNPAAPVDRDYEARLHDHYGRPVYWL